MTLFDGAGGEVEARIVRVGRDETELALERRRRRRLRRRTPAVGATPLCC